MGMDRFTYRSFQIMQAGINKCSHPRIRCTRITLPIVLGSLRLQPHRYTPAGSENSVEGS